MHILTCKEPRSSCPVLGRGTLATSPPPLGPSSPATSPPLTWSGCGNCWWCPCAHSHEWLRQRRWPRPQSPTGSAGGKRPRERGAPASHCPECSPHRLDHWKSVLQSPRPALRRMQPGTLAPGMAKDPPPSQPATVLRHPGTLSPALPVKFWYPGEFSRVS